ncbi:MAG: hypothetical protein KDB22_09870 [Planctomycetales bacterium]|nr:hypothetical protein [Planctomycetales bacterium]
MHAIELAELAVVFVRNIPVLLTTGCVPSRAAMNAYWLASRFRHDEWSCRLARHRVEIQRPGVNFRNQQWHQIYPVLQEVLLTEPLTRCVAYFASIMAHHKLDTEFVNLAQTSFVSHLEARNRCLNLIVFGQGIPSEDVVRLNRLRKSMESLTDELIASLENIEAMKTICFDIERTEEAHQQLSGGKMTPVELAIHTALLLLSMRRLPNIDIRSGCQRLNRNLSHAILDLMPPQMFDDFGTPKTREFAKYYTNSPESDGMKVASAHPLFNGLITTKPQRSFLKHSDSERRW